MGRRFIQAFFLNPFVEEIGRTSDRTRADIEAEFLAAARRASDDPELAFEIDPKFGEVKCKRGGVLVEDEDLADRICEELNAVLLRYFPAPTFSDGTLGALLSHGGEWTRGVTGRSGDVEITLERAFFDFHRTNLNSGWVEYGFVTVMRKGGTEVFRGGCGADTARLGTGDDAPYLSAFARGDNDGIVRGWAALPTSEVAKTEFVRVLESVAEALAAGQSMNAYPSLEALLVAAIAPPIAGGLWAWMDEALPRLLRDHVHEVEHEGVIVRFTVTDVYPPGPALAYFGNAAVRITATTTDPERIANPEGEPIQAGSVGPESLAMRGPRDDVERRDLEAIVIAYRDWLAAHLDHHVATRGIDGIESFNYFYAFDGYFPLVQLLEQRIAWGPPGPPPVPAFDDAALARAGKCLERAPKGDALAAFRAEGWTIRLYDGLDDGPFGSHCAIRVVPPDGGEPVDVMMVDAWNPPARTCVDGDAFAFRRFVTWLREGILRAGIDEPVRFVRSSEDDAEDDEEDIVETTIAEWLLFRMPDDGDRFLVDWRAQWHIVNAERSIESFAGIYGFSGPFREKLARDIPLWRRFLSEVIDARFAKTTRAADS